MEAISWRKAKNLIRNCDCAYLYSDGSLYLVSRETVRGTEVEIKTLIKGYVKPWKVHNYTGKEYFGERDDRPARIIFYSRTDKGCLTIARPESVEVHVGSCSQKSKDQGIGTVGIRFRYGNGEAIKLEYLSQGHLGDRFGAETWEHYMVAQEFTVQTGLSLDDTKAENYAPEYGEVFDLSGEVTQ